MKSFLRWMTLFIVAVMIVTLVLLGTSGLAKAATAGADFPYQTGMILPLEEAVALDPLAILAIILIVAFMVETIVEFTFAPFFDKIPTLTPFKWIQMYIALAVGVVAAVVYKFDVIFLLGLYFKQPIPVTMVGVILTGLAVGKGSNYLHDLISKWLAPKPVPGLVA